MTFPLTARQRGLVLLALTALVLVAVIWLSNTLVPFFVAFALVYLLNPIVTGLSRLSLGKWNLGRGGAIVVVYVGFFLSLWFVGLVVAPQLYNEFVKLAHLVPKELVRFEQQVLPDWVVQWQTSLDAYNVPLDIKQSLQDGMMSFAHSIQGEMGDLVKRARDLVAGVFSLILSCVLVFMLTGFLLYDLPRLKGWLMNLIPDEYREGVVRLGREIDRGLSGAVRGQLGVCLVNGVLTAVGLMAMHVKFAITLGVVAAVCSLVPVFGTLISTIPAVLIGLTQSIWTALLVLIWILLIHLVEANLLNPKIIGHNAELHPALVVLALLLGEHYGGAVGLLVAVPLATVVRALIAYTIGRLLLPEPPPSEPSAPSAAVAAEPSAVALEPSARPASSPQPEAG